jgi:regulator of PEP synthase PpsR (kinase-PPPase family)
MSTKRTVFYLSDGTGITAETLGRSLISQFENFTFTHVTIPYINNLEEAQKVVSQINATRAQNGNRPIIVATLVNEAIRKLIATTDALFLDVFNTFVGPLEQELNALSTHRIGRTHAMDDFTKYQTRIEAIDFTIATDDGSSINRYKDADLILVGVSRCGKTPTSLYLALQHGLCVANYPITEEDLNQDDLPAVLLNEKKKLFGLMIDSQRLQSIRSERRPNSQYASLATCQKELRFAENMFLHHQIKHINTTSLSIEEIATKIITQLGLKGKLSR